MPAPTKARETPHTKPSSAHSARIGILRHAFGRVASRFDDAGAVHSEVRTRLLDRLEALRGEPDVILDLGAGTGHLSRALKSRFRGAQVLALDLAEPMLHIAGKQQRFLRRFERVCGDAFRLPFKAQSVDWCVSNLMLPWCVPPDGVFAEVARILKPQGLFSFTSLGPDTLIELHRARVQANLSAPKPPIDMHDVGDALLRAGFAEPVMDVERIVLTYTECRTLLQELKDTGFGAWPAETDNSERHERSLAGRKALASLVNAYETQRVNGRLSATFEIVYGQAWRLETSAVRATASEVRVPLSRIRRGR